MKHSSEVWEKTEFVVERKGEDGAPKKQRNTNTGRKSGHPSFQVTR